MPTYDYKCSECEHLFETMHSMKDDPLTKCPECGKETLVRLIGSGSGMIFKGSGFYLTDYKNTSSGSASASSSAKPKTESKPAADSTSSDSPQKKE
ncbi:MAG: zinc ribbon domain-containing protein [Bacteriovoracaceae bacterium]